MITCPDQEMRKYWRLVENIKLTLMHDTRRTTIPESVIFGIDIRHELLEEKTRAWLRHAVRWWYAAMTAIDKHGGVFNATNTLLSALKGLREAAIRWAASIRSHYVSRKHTKLVGIVAQKERERFAELVTVLQDGTYSVSQQLDNEIKTVEAEAQRQKDAAKQARDAARAQHQGMPRQG